MFRNADLGLFNGYSQSVLTYSSLVKGKYVSFFGYSQSIMLVNGPFILGNTLMCCLFYEQIQKGQYFKGENGM